MPLSGLVFVEWVDHSLVAITNLGSQAAKLMVGSLCTRSTGDTRDEDELGGKAQRACKIELGYQSPRQQSVTREQVGKEEGLLEAGCYRSKSKPAETG